MFKSVPWESVVITLPIHPLAGQCVPVDGLKKQSGRQYVLVRHPDGSKVGLPLDWTDRWPQRSVPGIDGRQPLLVAEGLQSVALAVEDLKDRIGQKFETHRNCMITSAGATERPRSRMDISIGGDSRTSSGCLGTSGASGIRCSKQGGRLCQ